MNNFKTLIKELDIETVCLGEEAQERLFDCGPDEALAVAENDGFQTVIVSDPGVYIPELNICAMNAMVCNNDDGMTDWAGTALFTVSPEGFNYAYIEQDPLLITLHNSIGKNASRMQSFVLEGVADKVISNNKKDYCKMPVVAVNNLKTISEKEIESEM